MILTLVSDPCAVGKFDFNSYLSLFSHYNFIFNSLAAGVSVNAQELSFSSVYDHSTVHRRETSAVKLPHLHQKPSRSLRIG
jgi:hypothetical protein